MKRRECGFREVGRLFDSLEEGRVAVVDGGRGSDWIVAQLAGRNGGRSYVVIEREVIGGAAPLLGIDA